MEKAIDKFVILEIRKAIIDVDNRNCTVDKAVERIEFCLSSRFSFLEEIGVVLDKEKEKRKLCLSHATKVMKGHGNAESTVLAALKFEEYINNK